MWKGECIYFAASLLGVTTGLRQGEIRGLRIQDVHPQYVTICGSWEERHGLHGAKWGSERLVPIPSRVALELDSLIRKLPYQEAEDLVFCGAVRGQPIRKEELEARFYSALDTVGINEESRRKRVLVWHSLRHTFNSVMKGKVDSAKLMKVVGHRQESTSMQYTHALPQDFEDVRALQENLIGKVIAS